MSELPEIIGALAGGARIILDDEGYPELRMPGPRLTDPLWTQLCRDGWLEPMANGGTFKISEAGYFAYVRSTDELRSEGLVAPNSPAGRAALAEGKQ